MCERVTGKSILINFDPFLDEQGLLRATGRIQQSEDTPYGTKHPILLPARHPVTRRLVHSVHLTNQHAGAKWVLGILRRQYWVLKGKKTIEHYLNTCVRCKRRKGTFQQPKIAPLPAQRLAATEPPFTHATLDHFGPIWHQEEGHAPTKAFGLVIACMTTRAINLTMLSSLTPDSFIKALMRHTSDFGKPDTIRLDNYSSHEVMEHEVDVLFSCSFLGELKDKTAAMGISWSWSKVNAPYTNGQVERMVQMAKDSMKKSLGLKMLNYESLLTVLKEAKRIINSRPLIALSDSEKDQDQCMYLTPNHLIYGHDLTGLPYANAVDYKPVGKGEEAILKRWENRQKVQASFQDMFLTQYVANMIELKQWKQGKGEDIKVGALCLIQDPKCKRHEWPIGIVTKLEPGPDGITRSCHLKTKRDMELRSVRSLVILCYPRLREDEDGEDRQLDDLQGDEGEPLETPRLRGRPIRPRGRPRKYPKNKKDTKKKAAAAALDGPELADIQEILVEQQPEDVAAPDGDEEQPLPQAQHESKPRRNPERASRRTPRRWSPS